MLQDALVSLLPPSPASPLPSSLILSSWCLLLAGASHLLPGSNCSHLASLLPSSPDNRAQPRGQLGPEEASYLGGSRGRADLYMTS